jgi:Flp pilus assembly protein TadG
MTTRLKSRYHPRHDERPRRGTAAVEVAVCLPVLLILIVGLWEVGRMVEVKQLLCNAVREGGRQAATGQTTTAQVQQYVINYLNTNGITGISTTNVTFQDLTNSSVTDPTQATQMDRLRVSVTVPYSAVRWSLLKQVTSNSNLTASADWFSMRDIPITVDTVIPPN